MDGVLADFHEAVKSHIGVYPTEISDELMTAEIRKIPTFWDDIPPMPDMMELWSHVRQYNPFILTASANWDRERCVAAKPKWLVKHLPGLNLARVHVVRRSEKSNFANQGKQAILVDDYHKNTSEWTKAGGHAILHTSAKESIAALESPSVKRLLFPLNL